MGLLKAAETGARLDVQMFIPLHRHREAQGRAMCWWRGASVFLQKVLIDFSRSMPRSCHLHIPNCLGLSSGLIGEQEEEEEGNRGTGKEQPARPRK